jgi:hypothetical protein
MKTNSNNKTKKKGKLKPHYLCFPAYITPETLKEENTTKTTQRNMK